MSTKPKYQQALSAVYEELGTDEHGLQQSAATQRLEQYGPNALNQQKATSLLQKFIAQFKDFMIIVLPPLLGKPSMPLSSYWWWY